jgi:hypothetical protein
MYKPVALPLAGSGANWIPPSDRAARPSLELSQPKVELNGSNVSDWDRDLCLSVLEPRKFPGGLGDSG